MGGQTELAARPANRQSCDGLGLRAYTSRPDVEYVIDGDNDKILYTLVLVPRESR